MSDKIGLVAGATGITGLNLGTHLARQEGWIVYGLARKPAAVDGIRPLRADLLNASSLRSTVNNLGVTHAFFTTWLKQDSEAKNIEVNGGMFGNLLDALDSSPLQHVTLVTGGKNYFGSFDDSGTFEVITPFREDQPRKPGLNFYYVQENILFERARKQGFSWNVHRPQTVIGYALGNSMNMGVALAIYATICKETGRAFAFPGSAVQYHGVSDVTDARILAKQLHWAATTEAAHNKAFNITNGDLFRWDWLWPELAGFFGIEAADYPGHAIPLEEQMRDAGPVWDAIVAKYGLRPYKITELAPWWHTDADLGRTFETFSDMSRSRELGFHEYIGTNRSFFDLFAQLRDEKIIP